MWKIRIRPQAFCAIGSNRFRQEIGRVDGPTILLKRRKGEALMNQDPAEIEPCASDISRANREKCRVRSSTRHDPRHRLASRPGVTHQCGKHAGGNRTAILFLPGVIRVKCVSQARLHAKEPYDLAVLFPTVSRQERNVVRWNGIGAIETISKRE